MSQKYIIGLTGNIATGKSIVRRMLQELGASTVDADTLVHMLQRPGTPVYKEIVETFGSFILNKDATINRKKLADIVFNIPDALTDLERITHPAVRQQLTRAMKKAPQHVVVIEAIKLIEGGLADQCDAIWVVTAPEDAQVVRLVTRRKMNSQEAIKRIQAQSSQQQKIDQADVVIDNSGDLVKTWNAVQTQFNQIPQPVVSEAPAEALKPEVAQTEKAPAWDETKLDIRRAKRGDLTAMAALIESVTEGDIALDEAQMMESLFSKGYLVALQDNQLLGLIGWQTENLIAGADDFFVKSPNLWPTVGKRLLTRVEEAVGELSCEANLLFLHPKTGSAAQAFLEEHGYKAKNSEDLIKVWREAAEEWHVENTILMVKQLLERRIMTPL